MAPEKLHCGVERLLAVKLATAGALGRRGNSRLHVTIVIIVLAKIASLINYNGRYSKLSTQFHPRSSKNHELVHTLYPDSYLLRGRPTHRLRPGHRPPRQTCVPRHGRRHDPAPGHS